MVGWPRMYAARPNPAHHALAQLEAVGVVHGLITQNVDRLHARAGSRTVVELHGALQDVRCMACGAMEDRCRLQDRLERLNPGFSEDDVDMAPDGDADLSADLLARFVVAACERCGGVLKPNVVFFGENVHTTVVAQAYAMVAEAEALLVVGTSLAVLSGYRFVRAAARQAIPIAIVNLGPTRGDAEASVKVDATAGVLLPRLLATLTGPTS